MKISVIIPVYNEEMTLPDILNEVNSSEYTGEIIVVDDGSSDNSYSIAERFNNKYPDKVKVLRHGKNLGKGAAIRTALPGASCELVLIQDADLEYDPQEYGKLIKPFEDKNVLVVYGSRNLVKNPRSYSSFYWGGVLLSKIANLLYGGKITDESTCYKVFRADLLRNLGLTCKRFEFCPEVTAKIMKRKIDIHEVPITYKPRSKKEGKKINWVDGIQAIWVLLKNRF